MSATTGAIRPCSRRPIVIDARAFPIVGSALLAVGVFLSGFVLNEPAPYEIFMAGLVGVWVLCGLKFSSSVMPLLALLVLFTIGGMLSFLQMDDWSEAPMYVAVTFFLCLTSVFLASVIEADHQRLRLIFRAYLFAAILTAIVAIVGYFGLVPGAEQFTLYGRARGMFADPNVFGPYLILPTLYLAQNLLTGRLAKAPFRLAAFLILTLAIFLSFSRATWGLFAVGLMLLVAALFVNRRGGRFRLRIVALSLVGVVLLLGALAVALQFEAVSDLFSVRAQLVQDYDAGRLGRFERHKLGFLLAMEKPLGIGPLAFGPIFGEDTHNVYLKAVLEYGWLGFVSYLTLVFWTLGLGFRYLLRDRPWQPFLMTAYITFAGHMLIGMVIDTDHWRHFYILLGILWGCFALERSRKDLKAPSVRLAGRASTGRETSA